MTLQTGLFSAAVAALLAVTVQDLRPNSQDTSAFYLGNIYEVLADPNVTRPSTPSPVAKLPPFSRPRHAVWVNSLWFLSLVMSLSCALWATSLHQWARRYIRLTQPARCSPEKRARMRAFFANGVDEMHVPWAVEGLPTLLHLSLFLFFGGLAIFLFNVDQEVFTCVVSWIAFFSIVYGLITLLPLIRHDSPYNTPLSIPAWFLYTRIQYEASKVLAFIFGFIIEFVVRVIIFSGSDGSWEYWIPRERYLTQVYQTRKLSSRWMLGVEKKAEVTVEEQSSEIDGRILGWTISALGDDDSLEKFFEAIPGWFSSKLVKDLERDFPETLLETFWGVLNGFMGRTFSSNSVAEPVKSRRDIICRDIINIIPCPRPPDNLHSHFDEAPVSIDGLQAMGRWFTHSSPHVSDAARNNVIWCLPRLQERDNRWITLASNACGLAADDIRRNVAMGGDNMFFATLIYVSRTSIHSKFNMLMLVEALTQFDIRHTLPRIQHDFCKLWNELVKNSKSFFPSLMLQRLRHLYVALHQSTDAVLRLPVLYPSCNITSHLPVSVPALNPRAVSLLSQSTDSPDASPHHSTSEGDTVSQQIKQENIIAGPPSPSDLTISSEIGDSSPVPAVTEFALPVHTGSRPIDASPLGGVAAAPQDIPSTATGISEILSHASMLSPTPTLVPVPALILDKSLTTYDAGAASISNPLLPASSIVSFSFPASPSSPVPPLPKTPSHPTGTTTLPRLRARGLVNSGNMCFVNAVLHLLVHSRPFWDLFRELGDLKGQRGARGLETGGAATPLVDATVRFFEEFIFKEEPPTTQQPLQSVARGKQGEDGEEKEVSKVVDSIEPTYIYDAMKEKRQLKILLVCSCAQDALFCYRLVIVYCVKDGKHEDAEEFLGLYLDALDDELVGLHTYIGTHRPASAPRIEELREVAQSASGQAGAEVGMRDHTVRRLFRVIRSLHRARRC